MGIRERDLDPDTLRRVLEAAGASPAPAARPARRPELVAPAFAPAPGGGVWVIPVETRAVVNGRDWRERSRLSKATDRAVSRAFGPALAALAPVAAAYHRGGRAVRCRLTRLGGRRLDPANLGSALKAVEDAVCWFLAIDDGCPRWRAEFSQSPGGPLGVRVELTAEVT